MKLGITVAMATILTAVFGTITPEAHASWKTWSIKWDKLEAKQHKRVAKAERCLNRYVHKAGKGRSSFASYKAWGKYNKRRFYNFRDNWWPYLRARMVRPSGSGAARWWPLARYVGWPTSQRSNFIYCVAHESGGNPSARNPSGASGLMQILPACRNWRDPMHNVAHGLRKYKAAGGWSPWVVM